MMIVREDLGNAEGPQCEHRAAIGQTVFLVGAGLIKRQRAVKIRTRLRQHGHPQVAADIADGGSGVSPADRSRAGNGIEKLGENLIGRNERCRGIRRRPAPHRGMPGVALARQCQPIKRVGENAWPHCRLLWPLRRAVQIVVVLRSQIIGQRIQSARRKRGGAGNDPLGQRWPRRLDEDPARVDFGHEVGAGHNAGGPA